MNIDITGHREQFLAFVEPYTVGVENGPLRLKVEHSFQVLEHVELLVTLERPSSELAKDKDLARAAVLAALYHDCGRFPQFRDYHTFVDAHSVNHAQLGLELIHEQGFFRHEADRVRTLAETAIGLHNQHTLPPDLTPGARLITDMVREADKLDILRIIAGHLDNALPEKDSVLLHVRDEPQAWTASVVADVLAGRVIRYSDLRYVNDFRLLLGTWLHELNFPATRSALAHSGVMDTILDGLPRLPEIEKAVLYLRTLLHPALSPQTNREQA
ncbi:MAG: HD domain-containing protein [Desulfovibrionaceae bacterium]|nr:HD domain-containing protein [Desulfovibrionaceae bacterium]